MSNLIDLTGEAFGRLKVVKYHGKGKNRSRLWLCKCQCGNDKITSTYKLNESNEIVYD